MTLPVYLPAEFKTLVSGLGGPDGPVVAPDGALNVAESDTGKILSVSESGESTVIAETGGQPNGMAFGPDGLLYVADAGLMSILRITPGGGVETYADSYQDAEFGGPNDLVFLPNGDLIFTDPQRVPLPDPAISPVYRVKPDGSVSAFALDLAYPNGIALSPDNNWLYVAEMRAHRLIAYSLGPDGEATGEKLIRRYVDPGAPDGLALDVDGQILQALPGIGAIAVVSDDGGLVDMYNGHDWKPTNLAFGGADMKTVYVTNAGDGSIFTFRHDRPGLKLLNPVG